MQNPKTLKDTLTNLVDTAGSKKSEKEEEKILITIKENDSEKKS